MLETVHTAQPVDHHAVAAGRPVRVDLQLLDTRQRDASANHTRDNSRRQRQANRVVTGTAHQDHTITGTVRIATDDLDAAGEVGRCVDRDRVAAAQRVDHQFREPGHVDRVAEAQRIGHRGRAVRSQAHRVADARARQNGGRPGDSGRFETRIRQVQQAGAQQVHRSHLTGSRRTWDHLGVLCRHRKRVSSRFAFGINRQRFDR